MIWNMITDFSENFKNSIRGKYDSKRSTQLTSDISGGAFIKKMFNELYEEFVKSGYKATKDYKDSDIDKAIVLH